MDKLNFVALRRLFVHAGMFHADDAFCVAAARVAGYAGPVLRVRDLPADYGEGDIAMDVGGKLDAEALVFDHHFTGGSDDGHAAIGKFWATHGQRVCAAAGADAKRVADRVYETLLGSLDSADIGVKDWEPSGDRAWRHLSASGLISAMNPPFGSPAAEVDAVFAVAVDTAVAALRGAIANAMEYIAMADAVKGAVLYGISTLILKRGGPWQEHVLGDHRHDGILYVVYPSERGGYCVQAVPDAIGSFGNRKALPQAWRGLRGAELATAVGEPNFTLGSALFCHPGGFIGGAENLADATVMAEKAVAW